MLFDPYRTLAHGLFRNFLFGSILAMLTWWIPSQGMDQASLPGGRCGESYSIGYFRHGAHRRRRAASSYDSGHGPCVQCWFSCDAGSSNWGLALRTGRMSPVFLDANSWTRLNVGDAMYGRWPGKRDVASFWSLLRSIDEHVRNRMEELVYRNHFLNSSAILDEINRLLAGCDGPERWNPFRDMESLVSWALFCLVGSASPCICTCAFYVWAFFCDISYKSWVLWYLLHGTALDDLPMSFQCTFSFSELVQTGRIYLCGGCSRSNGWMCADGQWIGRYRDVSPGKHEPLRESDSWLTRVFHGVPVVLFEFSSLLIMLNSL